MRLTTPMLADALVGFLREHEDDLDGFVARRFDLADGSVLVRWSEDPVNKRLVAKVTGMGFGQATLWEREFTLKIDLLHAE